MIRFGVDFGGTKIEAAALDIDGRFVARVRGATPPDYPDRLDATREVLAEAERQAGVVATRVGVGGPGSPSPVSGLMRNSNSTVLNDRPFPADLARVLARPVRYANDADCLALSEATDGAGAGADVVFAVILGTGVGAGVAVGGRVLQGPNGLAGEWGHNPLPWPRDEERPGPACYCGAHGCIETWLSGPALAADLAAGPRAAGATPLDAPAIVRAAEAGDPACRAALERHAERLGRSLATVINLLDPDVVVLAGGLSQLPGLAGRLPSLWTPWVFGASPTQDPARFRHWSPVTLVRPGLVPFFVVQGTGDNLVPHRQTRAFVDRLRAQPGQQVFYLELPGAPHAFEVFHSLRAEAAASAVHRFCSSIVARQMARDLTEGPATPSDHGSAAVDDRIDAETR